MGGRETSGMHGSTLDDTTTDNTWTYLITQESIGPFSRTISGTITGAYTKTETGADDYSMLMIREGAKYSGPSIPGSGTGSCTWGGFTIRNRGRRHPTGPGRSAPLPGQNAASENLPIKKTPSLHEWMQSRLLLSRCRFSH